MKQFLLVLLIITFFLALFISISEILSLLGKRKREREREKWDNFFYDKHPGVNRKKAREADINYISSWRLIYDERNGRYVKIREGNVRED